MSSRTSESRESILAWLTPSRASILAVIAAVTTIGLKVFAYVVTGSAGLLSDAVESVANLITAVTVLIAVRYARKPADRTHQYGHGKAEFFAAGIEGVFIGVAAIAIIGLGAQRLLSPVELEAIGLGSALALVATAVNLVVGLLLVRSGRFHRSTAIEADGRHLLTDVWTSGGVIAGLIVVGVTGQLWLDSVIAIVVGLNILRTGYRLISDAIHGLMDRSLPSADEAQVRTVIEEAIARTDLSDMTYHALRTRDSGTTRFIDFHLLVPGRVSVSYAHDLAERMEQDLAEALPGSMTTIHVEPVEEQQSWDDAAPRDVEVGGGQVHRFVLDRTQSGTPRQEE